MTELNLKVLLENLRIEATRLQRDGLDIDTAYRDALPIVFKLAAEAQEMSPFEMRVLAAIDQAARDNGGKPVPTIALAVRLGVDNRFTVLYHLRGLERKGLIYRPMGPRSKSGWAVAA